MPNPNQTHKRSKLGFLIRLVGILILIGLPLFMFSPELFGIQSSDPNKSGLKLKLEVEGFHLHVLSTSTKIFLLIIVELHTLILITGLFAVAKMLDMFTNEHWFLPDFSKLLKIFGISLITYSLSSGIAHILTMITLMIGSVTYSGPLPSDVKISFFFSSHSLLLILIGVLLVYVSRVLSKASKNAQDLEKIV